MNEALPPEQWKDHVDAWTPHLGRERHPDFLADGYRLCVGAAGSRYVQARRPMFFFWATISIALAIWGGWFMGQGPRATWRDVLVGVGLLGGPCVLCALIDGIRRGWFFRDRVYARCPAEGHARRCVHKELVEEAKPLLYRCVLSTEQVGLVLRTDLCDRVLVVAWTGLTRDVEELTRMFGALSAYCRVYPGIVFHGDRAPRAHGLGGPEVPLLRDVLSREGAARLGG